MRIFGNNNASQLALCLKAAPQFLLSDQEATTIILEQVNTIRAHWDDICDEAKLSAADRALLYGRHFSIHSRSMMPRKKSDQPANSETLNRLRCLDNWIAGSQ